MGICLYPYWLGMRISGGSKKWYSKIFFYPDNEESTDDDTPVVGPVLCLSLVITSRSLDFYLDVCDRWILFLFWEPLVYEGKQL